jgi:hypothetical protein
MFTELVASVLSLPGDVTRLIYLDYVGLCNRSAMRIQRWWRQLVTQGWCDDCKRRRPYMCLKTVPACSDIQILGNMCCSKIVCKRGCMVYCSNGHCNFLTHDDGFRYPADCIVCDEKVGQDVCAHCMWFGDLSPTEARDRYWFV